MSRSRRCAPRARASSRSCGRPAWPRRPSAASTAPPPPTSCSPRPGTGGPRSSTITSPTCTSGGTRAARTSAGCTPSSLERGYKGGYGTIRDYVQPFRESGTAPPAVPGPPKARDLASWILTDPDNLDDDEKEKLARARERCPHLDALAGHVTEFAKILTGRHGDRLDDWITAVEADDQPDLHSFARGIKHDHQAVLNGLTMPCSSGVVEGNVNRLKMLKRQTYGRASFELLRKRVLLCQ